MIELINVHKTYGQLQAVKPLSLSVRKGAIHGIVGTSGAGKSTLIRMMNLLEVPDGGSVSVNGVSLMTLSATELRKERQKIGMIFQQFQLVLNRTVGENVAMPLELMKKRKDERTKRVKECLTLVGLLDKIGAYPAQLSGGQKQRVAIARALASSPSILLCDEPTSSLDPETTMEILQVLQQINEQLGVTIVIVTHDMDVVKAICTDVSLMQNGQLIDQFSIEPIGFPTFETSYFESLKDLAVRRT